MTVYFIQAKNPEGLVKIGWCKGDDPTPRLKELQTGCPDEPGSAGNGSGPRRG